MDRSDLGRSFAAVAGGLVVTENTSADELSAAQLLLARTLAAGGEVERIPASGLRETPADADPDELPPRVREDLDAALAAASTGEDPGGVLGALGLDGDVRAVRRSDPVAGPGSVPPSALGQRIERTLGPFADRDGRPVWIDVIRAVRQAALFRSPEATALLTLPLAGLTGSATSYRIAPGSVWVSARALTPGAPAGGYCGVRITGGTLRLSVAAKAVGQTLVVPAGTRIELALQLEEHGPTGPRPELGAATSSVQTPREIRLIFEPGGARLRSDDIACTVYGSAHGGAHTGDFAVYDAALARVAFPYADAAATFAAVADDLLRPRGEVPVERLAWGLQVAVAASDQLGEAAGTGGVLLALGAGLHARWDALSGGGGSGVALGAVSLVAEPGRLDLVAVAARGPGTRHRLRLWTESADGGPSELELGFDRPGQLTYASLAATSESLIFACTVDAAVDRPRQASGARFALALRGTARLWRDGTGEHVVVAAAPPSQLSTSVPAAHPLALALTNALLTVTPPLMLTASGDLTASATALSSGVLSLWMRVRGAVLTLPDPYVTTQPLPQSRGDLRVGRAGAFAESATLLLATVTWPVPETPELAFQLVTDVTASTNGVARAVEAAVPSAVRRPTDAAAETPTEQPPPTVANPFALVATPKAAARERPNPDKAAAEDAAAQHGLDDIFEEVAGSSRPSLFLLDVSSNVDQLGVGFGVSRRGDQTHTSGPALSIERMHLVAPVQDVRLFLLPQFQWEPVTNLPNPDVGPFPDRLVSGDDGGPTLLGSRSVHLVPVRPDRVADRLVTDFREQGETVGASFTLPFGIRAASMLFPRSSGADAWSQLREVRPESREGDLVGGRQFAVVAQSGEAAADPQDESPTLPGASWQTRNAVDPMTLAPTGFSVLRGDVFNEGVEAFFNDEMGPSGSRPRVPVTRVDFSGYGASLFSRWADPAAVAAVGQVRFDAVAGRTAYEVVQVVSILYPWAVPVVRTITLERAKEGGVLRADSGWVATGPGVYRYPPSDPGVPRPGTWTALETHPGAVRGVHDVRRIRETGRVVAFTADAQAVELLEVRFDADVDIDGVVRGQDSSSGLVPGLGHVGFVQRAPQGHPLSSAQLAAFFEQEGPVGGPAPCVVDVGGSGQLMDVVRVEVDRCVAVPPGVPEFAAAARGGLHLPSDGEWTVTRRRTGASVPEPVDRVTGVPLVRAGRASAPGTASPYYRFSEAGDLLRETAPQVEFALVQSSDGHQAQFARPRLEVGSSVLDSTEAPRLADLTVRATAAGQFVAPDACFRGPAAWDLRVGADGRYTFAGGASTDFSNTAGERAIIDSAGFAIHTAYAGPIRYRLDAGASPAWAVDIEGVTTSMDLGPFDDLMGVRHAYRVADGLPARMDVPEQLYAPFLDPVVSILRFLTELLGGDDAFAVVPVPGSFKFQAKVNLPVPPWAGDDDYLDLGGLKLKGKLSAAFGWSEKDQWFGSIGMDFAMKVPALPPIFAGGKASVALKGSAVSEQTVTIRVLWGLSLTASLGPIGVTAEFNFGVQVVVSTGGAWQIGLLIEIVGKASVLIVVIAVRLELMAAIGRPAAPGAGVEFVGRAKFAAEVTLCWFLTVSVEYTVEYKDQLAI